MTEFLARIGDRINPIVVKETRQAVSSRLVAGFLLLFLAVQLLVMLLMITGRELVDSDDVNLRAGREMFLFVQGILLGTCMVLIPTMTGARLAAERSDVNVDLLFISSLTPRAVLSGKLFAGAALALLIFSACAPFMTFAYVMRGLDVPTIFIVLVADYVAVLAGTTVALFLASVPANRGMRIFLGVGGFVFICFLGGRLLARSSDFLQGDSEFDTGSRDFWINFAGVAGFVFGLIGLFFVWSVALISPPAANRMYPVRVYTLIFWVATGIGFGLWSRNIKRPEPIELWGLIGCVLFSLQLVIAVSERDGWGARVARRIPRRLVYRIPAFFFYTGAAGGIAFGVIGTAVSALVVELWPRPAPAPRVPGSDDESVALAAALIAAYTYLYALSAAVFRRLLVGTTFRPGYTWVLALILFGLGCMMPYIIRFAFFERSSRYGYTDDVIDLYLPNPVVMIPDALQPRYSSGSHVDHTVVFLVVWGVLVTAANVPWFVKQVTNFRPPDDEGDE